MRKIKFKIWDSIAGVMYEPFELKDFDGGMAEHYIYLQFTGLLDNSGKEIYEGDIVDVGENIEVKFDNGAYVLLGKNYSDYLYNFEDIEVIGNVWENPELLK